MNLAVSSVISPTLPERTPLLALVQSESSPLLSLLVTPVAAIAVDFSLLMPPGIVSAPLIALMTHQVASQAVAIMSAGAHPLSVVSRTPSSIP